LAVTYFELDVDRKVLIEFMTKPILVMAAMATAILETLLVVLLPLAHLVEVRLETIFLRVLFEIQQNPLVSIGDTDAKGSNQN
jgi:hypothetical protein